MSKLAQQVMRHTFETGQLAHTAQNDRATKENGYLTLLFSIGLLVHLM